jgi:hypothetical protein
LDVAEEVARCHRHDNKEVRRHSPLHAVEMKLAVHSLDQKHMVGASRELMLDGNLAPCIVGLRDDLQSIQRTRVTTLGDNNRSVDSSAEHSNPVNGEVFVDAVRLHELDRNDIGIQRRMTLGWKALVSKSNGIAHIVEWVNELVADNNDAAFVTMSSLSDVTVSRQEVRLGFGCEEESVVGIEGVGEVRGIRHAGWKMGRRHSQHFMSAIHMSQSAKLPLCLLL